LVHFANSTLQVDMARLMILNRLKLAEAARSCLLASTVRSTSWRRERARPAFRRAMEKGAPGMTLLLD
jgi:hypothetical protein